MQFSSHHRCQAKATRRSARTTGRALERGRCSRGCRRQIAGSPRWTRVELRTGECGEGHCLLGFDAFVYINVIWFGCWIGFGIENYPYGLLTMVVSLEAIFLSTFVLISHPRSACSEAIFGSSHFALLTVHSALFARWTDGGRCMRSAVIDPMAEGPACKLKSVF